MSTYDKTLDNSNEAYNSNEIRQLLDAINSLYKQREIEQEELKKSRLRELLINGSVQLGNAIGSALAAGVKKRRWKEKLKDINEFSSTINTSANIRNSAAYAAKMYDPLSSAGNMAGDAAHNILNNTIHNGDDQVDLTHGLIHSMSYMPAVIGGLAYFGAQNRSQREENKENITDPKDMSLNQVKLNPNLSDPTLNNNGDLTLNDNNELPYTYNDVKSPEYPWQVSEMYLPEDAKQSNIISPIIKQSPIGPPLLNFNKCGGKLIPKKKKKK